MSIVRDVALALGVGTDDILGNNYFPTQVSMASVFVIDKQNKGFREVTGHITLTVMMEYQKQNSLL